MEDAVSSALHGLNSTTRASRPAPNTAAQNDLATRPAHTPGPWDASHDADGDYAIFSFGGILVCVTEADTSEDAANARLIAAAPDMLAALKNLTALIRNMRGDWLQEQPAFANSIAAIAKSGGPLMSLVWQDPESRAKSKPEAVLPLFAQPHATARNSDPDTSHEAAAAFTEHRLTEIQSAVLKFFRAKVRATDQDVEDALSGQYPAFSTLRKRRTDLVQRGFLCDSGARQPNRNNRKMIVWEITPEASHV